MDGLFAVLIVGVFVGAPIYLYVVMRQGEILRFETLATPDEVMMTGVGQVGTARGWATVTQTPSNVALSYVRTPNILVAVLLFMTCVGIPAAAVYWQILSKKESLNIMMGDSPTGNTRIQITSNGWKGKRAGQAVRDAIGVAPGTTVSEVANETPAIPGAPTRLPAAPPAPSLGGGTREALAAPVGATAPPPTRAIPAAWYDDPEDPTQQRYWDGNGWTESRAPKG